jgi:Protein of unknown function (DUF2584)
MGMPCEINTILKLSPSQGYPQRLDTTKVYLAQKTGYRIFAVDVPIMLVDNDWVGHADIVITQLKWENNHTFLTFKVVRIYQQSFAVR